MKILFDQGTPVPLRRCLVGHTVMTTFEMGWSRLINGDLLAEAESQFEAFVTTDKNLRYPQNLAGRRHAILVLPFASWPKLQDCLADVVAASDTLQPNDFVQL